MRRVGTLIAPLAICVLVANTPSYADDTADQEAKRRMMMSATFLNASCTSPEGVKFEMFETDSDKPIGRCFDKDGKLVEERYVDEHNNSVLKMYKDGQVLSEITITEEQLLQWINPSNTEPVSDVQ